MPEPRRLFIVDCSNLLFRAYHAVPPMTTRKGEPTNAVFGFTSMLMTLLERQPDYIAAALDVAAPTHRRLEMETYKANRKPTPDDLKVQMPRMREILDKMSIPRLSQEGHEADDVIGTLARHAEDQGLEVTIVSGDKDLLQLVTDRIHVMAPRSGLRDTVIYDPQQVVQRFGVPPTHVADLKALMGDPSDNLPGMPGIGEKTAAKLIQEHGSVEGILADTSTLAPRWRAVIEENRGLLEQMLRMVTLRTDLELGFDLEECRWGTMEMEPLLDLFDELEFRSLSRRLWPLVGGAPSSSAPAPARRPEPEPEPATVGISGLVPANEPEPEPVRSELEQLPLF